MEGDDNRLVNGRWVSKKDNVFMEFVDNEWRTISSEQTIAEGLQAAYDQAPSVQSSGPKRCVWNGQTMIWNEVSQQWIPEGDPDDEILARYRLQYGVQDDNDVAASSSVSQEEETKPQPEKDPEDAENDKEKIPDEENEAKPEETKKRGAGWVELDESKSTTVYVTNLPTEDFTIEEFMELMSKCGVIMRDPRTNKPKVKLYRDSEGNLKGDGTCCYVKHESVNLAFSILDGMRVRDGEIKLDYAKFELKGEYDPSKKRRKLSKAQRKRHEENQNRHFKWEPEKSRAFRPVCECTVVIKHLFTLDEMEADVLLGKKLKEEVNESCSRYGTVKKVHVHENNPDGAVSVTFESVEHSDLAVKSLNGRLVKGRTLEALLWDGKTKYEVAETEEQRERRLRQWSDYLEGDGEESSDEEQEAPSENISTSDV